MNKKEISLVKRQFKCGNKRLTANRVASALVINGNIMSYDNSIFERLDDVPQRVLMNIFKSGLAGSIGKNIFEYAVNIENFNDGNIANVLLDLNKNNLSDDEKTKDFITSVIETISYPVSYYITIGQFTFNVPKKSEDVMDSDDDDEAEDDGVVHNFIMCCFSELKPSPSELCYDEQEKTVAKRDSKFIVSEKCMDAFMYPLLNDGETDVNSVIYRTSMPKNPHKGIIEELLRCEYNMSADEQQTKFNTALMSALDFDVNYDVVSEIHEKIRNKIYENSDNTEPTEVGVKELKKIISQVSGSEETAEKFESSYNEDIGEDKKLLAVNLVDAEKVKIKSPSIKIDVKSDAQDRVKTDTINGQKCIVIEFDETVEINGINAKI